MVGQYGTGRGILRLPVTHDTTTTDSDTTRRTDLRTLDRHASAREVYAALDCPYPGTRVREEKARERSRESTQQARRRGSDAPATDATGDRRGEEVSL